MAQRDVSDEEAAIERGRRISQRFGILAEAPEAEPTRLAAEQVQRRRRDAVERERSQADAAIAGDEAGDALAHLRRHVGHRQEGAVVVGMRVDEARRHDLAGGVDFARTGGAADPPQRHDAITGDRNIGTKPRRAGTVDDRTVADDRVDLAHRDPPVGGWCCRQCSAISPRRQIQTRSWRCTWSRKRANAAARPGLPASRQCSATVIIFGAVAPSM